MKSSPDHEYRPDVDGLRALAVVVVILFHAYHQLLPGGFVGVDVFFVISGYLITGIILRESRAGTFTLQNFYARRCRRILPALVVVLVATWAIGRAALTEQDFHNLGKHILGGATFTSNILLWRETGYFDVAAARKPLLHLWSLGVEEQFYLVWPPTVMLAVLLRWRRLPISVAIFGASLILAIGLMPLNESATFYLLPTRMWELLTGAVLVQTEWARNQQSAFPRRFKLSSDFRAALGLVLILIVCVFYPGESVGGARIWWLVAPVAGAALIISAADAWINRKLLARDTVVLVGLISYPLYLWHWPLLSTVRLLAHQATPARLALLLSLAVVLSFVLAWMTWRWVERPLRRLATAPLPERRRRNRLVLDVSACALLVLGVVGWSTWDRGQLGSGGVQLAGEPLLNGEVLFPGTPFHRISSADSVVLLVGDSHADHLLAGLVPEAEKHGFGVSHVGYYGCPGVHFSVRLWGPPDLFEQCQTLVDSTFSYFLRDSAVKVILFAARGSLYTTGTDSITTYAGADMKSVSRDVRMRVLHDGYSDAIRRIEGAGKRVVVFLDVPELFFDPLYCAARLSRTTSHQPPCAVRRQSTLDRQSDYRAVVQRLQKEHPRLAVFDPLPLLCDADWCYAKRDGVQMYGDNNHVNDVGSRLVAESLGPLLFKR